MDFTENEKAMIGNALMAVQIQGKDAYVVAALIQKVKKWIAEGKQEEGDA